MPQLPPSYTSWGTFLRDMQNLHLYHEDEAFSYQSVRYSWQELRQIADQEAGWSVRFEPSLTTKSFSLP